MEQRIAETLAQWPAAPRPSLLETTEHLALLKRWFYRGSRTGEIFFADDRRELPLRRVVRGIGRVLRGEKAGEVADQAAPEAPRPQGF